MASYQKVICIAAIFLFILISGCVDCETDEDCTGHRRCVEDTCENIYRPKGVDVSFQVDSPPAKIKADDPFDIILELTNKGSASVEEGKLEVEFYGGRYSLSDTTWLLDKPLRGAEDYETVGALEFKDFMGVTYTGLAPAGPASILTIGATLKYEYETSAKGSICITSPTDDAPFCTESGDKLEAVSSAPVTVSKIEEQIFSDSVDVAITVVNVGGGDIYRLGGDSVADDDIGIATLTQFELGSGADNDYLDWCESTEEYVSATAGATFYCKEIPRTTASTVEEIANITVAYNYKTDISAKVEVFAH